MKKAFTLVEIIVVLALFGILVLVGTEFVIHMIRANNKTIIQNEVRQNANRVMQLLTNSIRGAGCVTWSGNNNQNKLINIYSTKDCTGTPAETYEFRILAEEKGRIYKKVGADPINKIISDSVAACKDSGCGATCNQNGLEVTGTSGTSGAIGLSLTLQQTPRAGLRSDF